MSILAVLVSLFSFLANFQPPLVKESVARRVDQIDVCAGTSCVQRAR